MNVAVGVVLILGSWVSADLRLVEGSRSGQATAEAERSAADPGAAQPLPDETPEARPSRGGPSSGQEGYRRPRYMPVAPTDISAETAGGYPLLTPTEQPQFAVPGAYTQQPTAAPPDGVGPMRRSTLPTSSSQARRQLHYGQAGRYGRQAQPSRSYVDYRIQQTQYSTPEYYAPSPTAVRAAVVQSRKPFATVKRSPAISPYLNLFRLDTEGGTIDNYTTLVRPEVRQMGTNVRFGGDIRSLENRNILQGAAIGRIGNATRSLQGRPSQDYYMNLLNFFPGFGQ